jgi:Putative Se/S carrier protein-like
VETDKVMDGLISFFASHHAIRAETVMKRNGLHAELIPGPKELSPNCGVALRFEYARRSDVLELLAARKVRIEGVHFYRPRTDDWRAHPAGAR